MSIAESPQHEAPAPGARPVFAELEKGLQIGSREITFSRADLIRYAAASGDHNPIHWNERFAREVGLEGVIAHGMLTMGTAADLVTAWAGDPGAVVDYQARFTKPVPVPDAEVGSPESPTAALRISGKIGKITPDEDDPAHGTVRVDLAVELIEQDPDEGERASKVLTKSQAVVRL